MNTQLYSRRTILGFLGVGLAGRIGCELYKDCTAQYPGQVGAKVKITNRGSNGDDIFFNGYLYKGIQPGDVIMRSIDINWGGTKSRIINRFISRATPDYYEHASVYIGNGRVLNIGPDDPENVILEKSLQEYLSASAKRFHVLRMSDDPKERENALDFLLFHQSLGSRIKFHGLGAGKTVALSNPQKYGYTYYVSGFNCNSAIGFAYNKPLQQSLTGVAQETIEYLFVPTQANLTDIALNLRSGLQLKKLATREIEPVRRQDNP